MIGCVCLCWHCLWHEGTTVGLTFTQSHAAKIAAVRKDNWYDVEVTLEIEGRIIHNVKMHTRGHSSAMCLGMQTVGVDSAYWKNDSSPRFPKHQFGLRLPKAIPLLGMMPARSVWIEKDASCRFEETLCSMHTIVIQYLNEQTGSVLNEFCRKKNHLRCSYFNRYFIYIDIIMIILL